MALVSNVPAFTGLAVDHSPLSCYNGGSSVCVSLKFDAGTNNLEFAPCLEALRACYLST